MTSITKYMAITPTSIISDQLTSHHPLLQHLHPATHSPLHHPRHNRSILLLPHHFTDASSTSSLPSLIFLANISFCSFRYSAASRTFSRLIGACTAASEIWSRVSLPTEVQVAIHLLRREGFRRAFLSRRSCVHFSWKLLQTNPLIFYSYFPPSKADKNRLRLFSV